MNERCLAEIMNCPDLPTLPAVALQIVRMARDPNADIRKMANLIASDPALSGKILKTVNSSFYGFSKTVSTISQALVILGLQSVRMLAMGFSLVSSMNKLQAHGFDLQRFWRRSVYSAVAARTLGEEAKIVQSEEVFLAGLLQDIGMLAMSSALEDRYDTVYARAATHGELLAQEREHLGLDHCQVGKVIAEKWSLPPLLAVPIACHHEPEQAGEDLAPLARVVHVGWLFSEVFQQEEPAAALQQAKAAALSMLQLEDAEVERLLKKVNASTHEIADVLEVQIGERVNCQRLLSEAREAMLHMTLQTQRQAAELQDRNADLERAASTDPLTGLVNRKCFDEKLAAEFQKARGERGNLCVLFVDVDHFKLVNDTYGHAAGDSVLRNLGKVIQSATEPMHVAARYGGEEFVVLAPGATLQTASRLAESVRKAVEQSPTLHEGRQLPVQVSVGVAGMDHGAFFEAPEQLLTFADRALYAAKRSGRNAVRICPTPQGAAR